MQVMEENNLLFSGELKNGKENMSKIKQINLEDFDSE